MLFLIKQKSPNVDFFVNKIKNNEYFYYCKLNHAFFEATCLGDEGQKQRFQILHSDLHFQIIDIIKNFPKDKNFLFAFSVKPYESFKSNSYQQVLEFLYSILPKHKFIVYDSLLFKQYCISGEITRLFDIIKLKNMKVILYGLDQLKKVNENINFSKFEFRKINIDATKEKEILINDLILRHESNSIYFFQLGEALSTWVIYNIHNKIKDSFFIDLGRSIDYFVDIKEMKFSQEDENIYRNLSLNKLNLNDHFFDCFSNKNWIKKWNVN